MRDTLTSSKLARGDVDGSVDFVAGMVWCGRKPGYLCSSRIWNVSFKVAVEEGSCGPEMLTGAP